MLLVGFLVSSCSTEFEGTKVDDELIPYFELFKAEAAERGIEFDNEVAQIEGYLQNIPDSGVLGACRRNAENENSPQIFLDKPYWRTATNTEREYVMFHELGHCFLNLDHENGVDSVGNCTSIMASGLSGCRNNYNSINREEYLDELFSQ